MNTKTNANTTSAADIVLVALDKLDIDPLNVRKTYSQTSIEELAESIAAQGIFQNLLVRKAKGKDRYHVSAGGRRYRAALHLVKEGRLAADHPVPVKVIDKAEVLELSLAENVMREAMNPADQYEAFTALAEAGQAIADIAARFGTTEAIVKKRLALGKVAPALMELYRHEGMTLEQLAAFTITDDHAEQVRVWESLPTYGRHASAIKQALSGEGIKATDKRLQFIGGLGPYEAAGGSVKRDLFDDQGGGYALDAALVERLVSEKLDGEAASILVEGWKWVETVPDIEWQVLQDYDRVYPQYEELSEEQAGELDALEAEFLELEQQEETEATLARMEAINERTDALEAITQTGTYQLEDMARAGALVTLTYNGAVRIERGLVRPEDCQNEEEAEGGTGVTGAEEPEGQGTPVLKHSATLIEDLTAQKTAALRMELAQNPDVALATVVHGFLLKLAYSGYGLHEHSALEVSVTHTDLSASMKQPDQCAALDKLDLAGEALRERLPANPAELWDWCMDQSRASLLDLLAWSVAQTLNVVEGKFPRPKQAEHGNQIGTAVQINMRDHFKVTAQSYFQHLQRRSIQAAVTEACGADFADGIAQMKKAEGAAFAETALKDKDWLPEPIRCGSATVPQQDYQTFHQFSEAAE